MNRFFPLLAFFIVAPVAGKSQPQVPSTFYPAPPPLQAPQVERGAPTTDLTSPLLAGRAKVARTVIDSETEAQLFSHAVKLAWGRYAKVKGLKPGEVTIAKQAGLWAIKGRIETEGNWASIDGVVERIAANNVSIHGEVAFRVAEVEKGMPCKISGTLHFRRSGKSQVWRLVEGDNPCDGTQEKFDLLYAKPVEKKPAPAQSKRS